MLCQKDSFGLSLLSRFLPADQVPVSTPSLMLLSGDTWKSSARLAYGSGYKFCLLSRGLLLWFAACALWGTWGGY
ncbi:hypothetical protein M430DRAFT_34387 [Amorphotheca resinae ATCC 22711]|uniref:Uncharacterized protein n=1 Tax=Amorphotheca resinae ATCC 22711 TaxID=857342 RepID=A0A2T3B742_AMORE|nr:hypothetical protein M430DRAFT_34387 [Amorphotheca resinae ATCC 22711]PSS22574.1 hypothetical protein M430DRAFT_34387 [Amorphotheca resinae ATCC 22711]